MHLIVRPDAEANIAAACAWYEEQREGLGREFLEEVHPPTLKPGWYRHDA